ncbi:hypothetical protein ACFQH8_17490 [Halomicroarcula sp. GCM10025710]
MDRLSSCYFCGVAHDESLSEYPVVPKQLHPSEDTQRTAVLCSTCRRSSPPSSRRWSPLQRRPGPRMTGP